MKRTALKRGKGFKQRKIPLRTKNPAKRNSTRSGGIPKGEPTAAKLKKELDRLFSLWIRATHPKVCYTCGKPAERLQNGHYISRQYLATRWDEHNCRPQCWGCNGYGKGQPHVFEERLKSEYGNDFVEEMKAKRHQTIKLGRKWYQQEIHRYTELLNNLTHGTI